MKVLLNFRFSDDKMKMLEDLACELIYIPEREMRDRDDFYDVDVWFTYDAFKYVEMNNFTNLKLIVLTSTGLDMLPIDYICKNNVMVANNKFGYSIPIAESIVMYILQVFKNSYQSFKKQEMRIWNIDLSWLELAGKRIGFLGTGAISKAASKRLKAFDVELWGVNTDGRSIEGFSKCFSLDNSDEFFRKCDVIVGVMPETANTSHIIDSVRLEMMKESSTLINVGRGNLIDLRALEKYIDKFRGVVLDVVEKEPLELTSYLWDQENVIITAHNSWVSDNNWERRFDNLYNNLKSYIETGKAESMIENIKRGY